LPDPFSRLEESAAPVVFCAWADIILGALARWIFNEDAGR
jgi:hypothetical protein